jgi:hypothetical protein
MIRSLILDLIHNLKKQSDLSIEISLSAGKTFSLPKKRLSYEWIKRLFGRGIA